MPDLFKSKKAQAATELAIIGSIIILAFSYLITFTAKINMRQELLQEVFRNMLQGAVKTGKSHASPTAFMRMPNILDPYAPGELTPIKASGSLLWSSGKAKSNDEAKLSAKWDAHKQVESGTYHKTFKRTEKYGEFPETKRTVDYGGVVRQGP